jgi:hypothetical protein
MTKPFWKSPVLTFDHSICLATHSNSKAKRRKTLLSEGLDLWANELVLWQTQFRLVLMMNYSRDASFENEAAIDFTELGEVKLDRLNKHLPY